MKNIIIPVLVLFMMESPLVSQTQNDNACTALEIQCQTSGYLHYETSLGNIAIASIANYSTNFAITGAQCANLPNLATLFYKITVNTPGFFTFSCRVGFYDPPYGNSDGIYGSTLYESQFSPHNFAVWKNVDCNSIMSANPPYPLRIGVFGGYISSHLCPYYCGGVTGLSITEPITNTCENSTLAGYDAVTSGFNVVPGDIIIIAINNLGLATTVGGAPVDIPFQLIFGGPYGGGGDNVKCCSAQYNLTDAAGNIKSQFCLGEQVFLHGFGVISSSFELELSDIDNTVIDKKSFSSASPDGINIINAFPTVNFTKDINYKIKLTARSPCGCTGIFLDFNFTCCYIDPLFSLNTEMSDDPDNPIKLVGESSSYGSHQWQLYNTDVQTGNILSSEPLWNSGDSGGSLFSTSVGGPCYFVKHTVSNICGSACSYLRYCDFNCEDKACNLASPDNLSFSNNKFQWNQVQDATSYIIQFKICDPACCVNNTSGIISAANIITVSVPQSSSPSHNLSVNDFSGSNFDGIPPCFSWQVCAVCPDGTNSMWGISQSACMGDATASECSYLRPSSIETDIVTNSLSNSASGLVLDIFPNPTSGDVSIKVSAQDEVEFSISIFNTTGSNVKTFESVKTIGRQTNINWDTKSLSKGIYLVKISTSDNKITTKKLIIE